MPPFSLGLPRAADEPLLRQLGEQLFDLAERAAALADANPGWIAPSQVAVAERVGEAAMALRLTADTVHRLAHDGLSGSGAPDHGRSHDG